jgi:hypothetical protein
MQVSHMCPLSVNSSTCDQHAKTYGAHRIEKWIVLRIVVAVRIDLACECCITKLAHYEPDWQVPGRHLYDLLAAALGFFLSLSG